MWRDARTVPDGDTIDADVCIVGSGPAGLTLARELLGRGLRIAILESGGREYDDATQSLCDGKFSGADHFEPLRNARSRQVGGMAVRWDSEIGIRNRMGFRAGPLDAIDFERREWLPHSGWPFGRDHLDPFYARVHERFGLGPYRYDAAFWERDDARALPVNPDVFHSDVWTFVPQEIFTQELPDLLGASDDVSYFLWANVVELDADDTATTATRAQVACLSGTRFSVTARIFVLAAGGMENARILLLSDRVQRGGLGNGENLVGRFFTEHQPVHGGTLFPASRALIDRLALYDLRTVDGTPVIGKLALRPEVAEREQLLGFSVALLPKHRRYKRAQERYLDSFATVARSILRARVPEQPGMHLRNIVEGADYIGARLMYKATGGRAFRDFGPGPDMLNGGGWSSGGDASRRYSVVDVHLHVEQAPHPENRVMLTDQRDALGCRRTHLHWLWRERDMDSVRRAQRILQREFRAAGVGEYRILSEDGRPVLEASGLHHHMGTTRMHGSPREGVVDPDSKVHGMSNLFVAGYSVFPTGGYINPSLTVLALSLRLADHLKKVLR